MSYMDKGHLFVFVVNKPDGTGMDFWPRAGFYSSSYFCLSCQCKFSAMTPKKRSFCNCVMSLELDPLSNVQCEIEMWGQYPH